MVVERISKNNKKKDKNENFKRLFTKKFLDIEKYSKKKHWENVARLINYTNSKIMFQIISTFQVFDFRSSCVEVFVQQKVTNN